jgi:hypothetical protein
MNKDAKEGNLMYKFQKTTYTYRIYLLLFALAVFAILPFVFSNQYFLTIIIKIGVYICLAMGLNILTGYTGLVSLGHAGFVAIGAYASSILVVKHGFNFFAASLVGMIVAGLIGMILGLPSLRVSGTYLSIITLGFGEIIKMTAMNFTALTNGTLGIKNIPKPNIFGFTLTVGNYGLYYMMLITVVVVSIFCYLLVKSKTGRALQAIKTDELAATMMGININYYKVTAFVVSAMICAFGGSLYSVLIGYIDPNTFNFDVSTLILSIVILGGMGTLRGMFIGALILIAFPEVSRFLMEYRFVLYGIILVIMMRFRPQGILGYKSVLPYVLSKSVKEGVNKLEESGR